MQAEAVNYIWARSIVLASLLCFAALLAWTRGQYVGGGGVVRGGAAGEGGVRRVPAGAAPVRSQTAGAGRGDAGAGRRRGGPGDLCDGGHARRAGGPAGGDYSVALPSGAGAGDPAVPAIAGGALRFHGRSGRRRPGRVARAAGVGGGCGRGIRRLERPAWVGRLAARRLAPADSELLDFSGRRPGGRPPDVPADGGVRGGGRPVAGTDQTASHRRRAGGASGPGERDTNAGVDDRGIALARGGRPRSGQGASEDSTGARAARGQGVGTAQRRPATWRRTIRRSLRSSA